MSDVPARSSFAGRVLLGAYTAAGAAAAAALGVQSLAATGSARTRLRERQGFWDGEGARERLQPWIWIHGASFGEAEIAIAVARALGKRSPGHRLVVSSMTATGKARVERESDVESRWFPVDFAPFVNRILTSPPRLFVAVETEIWPETLRRLALAGVPVAFVNARLSQESLPRYRWLRALLAPLLGRVRLVAARDEEAAARWQSLGVPPGAITVTGNIKFDLATSGAAAGARPLFARAADAPLLVAASTHDGEEAAAIDAFVRVRARNSSARLVIAPRHPERGDAVVELARARGLAVVSYGAMAGAIAGDGGSGDEGGGEDGGGGSDIGVIEAAGELRGRASPARWPEGQHVVVLDRLGLLNRAYVAADAAFVGGSLEPGPGGHNLLEPVVAGCGAIAAGAHLGNVADQAGMLRQNDALTIVSDVEQLSSFWVQALEYPERFRLQLDRARDAVVLRQGALGRTVNALAGLLDGPGSPAVEQQRSPAIEHRSPLVDDRGPAMDQRSSTMPRRSPWRTTGAVPWFERLWYADTAGAATARAMLAPLSLLFAAGVRLRGLLYDRHVLRQRAAPAPVVSVGGLSVGGSGKTPFVLWLAARLSDEGLRVCIVTRGYGGASAGSPPFVLRAGEAASAEMVGRAGDEAVLLALRSGCPVAIGSDRAEACELAARTLAQSGEGPDVFVLDDGFQHRALARDLEIVLIGENVARARLLPAGPLREPLSALARADAVVEVRRSGSMGGKKSEQATGADVHQNPCLSPVFRTRPACLVASVSDAGGDPPSILAGRDVVAVAAIANPERFLADLEACGARIAGRVLRRDHHRFDAADCREIEAAAAGVTRGTSSATRVLVVTTEKDLVKLAHAGLGVPVVALRIEIEGDDAEEARIVGLATGAIRANPRGCAV